MQNLLSEWSRLLIVSLADAGVRDVVVSPGSRSTSFVLAAASEPRLRLWDVHDERAAAFFALGQARVTGRPSLLLCTSGTAGANYLPAVVEAGMSHLPLLVLTADRPVDLVACGANQTIDQLKLFGDHARRFFDLGQGDPSPRALRALRRTVAQATLATRWPEPGAVHLNARAKKPLEPQAGNDALRAAVDELLGRPIVRATPPRPVADPAALDALAEACRRSERGLIVAGPAGVEQAAAAGSVEALSRRTGFPILADAASQLRFVPRGEGAVWLDTYPLLFGDAGFRRAHRPELIVQIGRAPTAAGWERYLAENAGLDHWVIARHGWHDPESTATHLVLADPASALRGLVERLETCQALLETRREVPGTSRDRGEEVPGTSRDLSEWCQALLEADRRAGELLEADLDGAALSEGAVARDVVAALPPRALLAVGNSLPIRHLDLYGRRRDGGVLVLSQRGTSGIDGVSSGALGAASVSDRPTVLLTGDVSFLHDLSGLGAARQVEVPCVLVVVQNRGGRIFEQLPLASHEAGRGEVFEHWTTPHDADLGHAAATFGLPFTRATRRPELIDALARALVRPGVSVIEAVVPPHGAAETKRRMAELLDETFSRS